jgi:hypothetical protein
VLIQDAPDAGVRKMSGDSVQIELIIQLQRAEGFKLRPSGNRKRCGYLFIMQRQEWQRGRLTA